MSIEDITSVLAKENEALVSIPASGGNYIVSRAQIGTPGDEHRPNASFPVLCTEGAVASTRMVLGVDGKRYVQVTIPKIGTGDESPTLPQLRRDAIRHGTSVALELLRREADRAAASGQQIVLNSHLAANIAKRLRVTDQQKEDLRHEMEIEMRRESAKKCILQDRSRFEMARLEALFRERKSS